MAGKIQSFQNKKWYRFVLLAIAILMTMITIMGSQFLSPMLPLISRDLIMTNAQKGLLSSIYMMSGMVLPLILIKCYPKYGIKKVAAAGGMIMVAGLISFIFAHTYGFLLFSRFISGIGSIIFMTAAPLIVSYAFSKGKLGSAMGIFGIAAPLGSFITINLFGGLGTRLGWRATTGIVAICASLTFLLILLFLPFSLSSLGIPEKAGKITAKNAGKSKFGPGILSLSAVAFSMGFGTMSYINFSPAFYLEHGYSIARVSFVISLYMGLNMFLAPFAGMLMDKGENTKRNLAVFGLSFLALNHFLLISPLPQKLLFGTLMGVATTAPPVAFFALMSEVVPPDRLSAAPCVITISSSIGQTIGSVLIGKLLDLGLGFQVCAVVMAAVQLFAAWRMWKIKKYTPEASATPEQAI